MKKNAIYPGTFDPITYGHIDVIKKALKIVDQVIVAISDGNYKNHLFDVEERISIVKKALFKDLNLKKNKIEVISFNSLTTSLCKKYKSNIILRGLRAVSDFEYEFQLAGMNRKLNKNIETIFLMSDVENQIISSKFVKEIAELNGDIKKFTTKSTIKSLYHYNKAFKLTAHENYLDKYNSVLSIILSYIHKFALDSNKLKELTKTLKTL